MKKPVGLLAVLSTGFLLATPLAGNASTALDTQGAEYNKAVSAIELAVRQTMPPVIQPRDKRRLPPVPMQGTDNGTALSTMELATSTLPPVIQPRDKRRLPPVPEPKPEPCPIPPVKR